ncbi:MAG: leucyl aminopeptidase family protein [Alphaproteobacteria bacterium]|nr:leucyl aminopeptidase family protein [Alphaproteobacteria bacterium]
MTKPPSFLTRTATDPVMIIPLTEKSFPGWIKKQTAGLKARIKEETFAGKAGQVLFDRDKDGTLSRVLAGVSDPVQLYDFSKVAVLIKSTLQPEFLKKTVFAFDESSLTPADATNACIGWALAGYRFDRYKPDSSPLPRLLCPKAPEKKRAAAFIEAISLVRDLINTPANDLGPEEMELAMRAIAEQHKATLKVTKGAALEKAYPLVHAVGRASPRLPRLIELRWGKATDPKLTLVGKGVCFDTGGLNLKPTNFMALMKKDMGGAAHALALAHLVMSQKVPVRLRLLVPAVDNDVSGGAFRPGDILQSRKGLTVENTNTDAEGRLILADALAAACEDDPALVIDFATLTGSARAALGPDVPPFFTNNDKLGHALQKAADTVEDPLWRMPLWQAYRPKIESPVADLVNSAKTPGDLIYSALFLERFLDGKTDWIHLDLYGWQDSGLPGKPAGGTDMGLRAVFALLEEKYATA